MSFHNRRYVIIPSVSIGSIDFNEVLETSQDTVRLSVDGTKTFVKYEGAMPPSVSALVDKSEEYGHEEMLSILSGPDWTWTDPNPPSGAI